MSAEGTSVLRKYDSIALETDRRLLYRVSQLQTIDLKNIHAHGNAWTESGSTVVETEELKCRSLLQALNKSKACMKIDLYCC